MKGVIRLAGTATTCLLLLGAITVAPVSIESSYAANPCKGPQKLFKKAKKKEDRQIRKVDKATTRAQAMDNRHSVALQKKTDGLGNLQAKKTTGIAQKDAKIDNIEVQMLAVAASISGYLVEQVVECGLLGTAQSCNRITNLLQKAYQKEVKLQAKKEKAEDKKDAYITKMDAKIASKTASYDQKISRALDRKNEADAKLSDEQAALVPLTADRIQKENDYNTCVQNNP